ncbi:MAG: CPBP family intramembrane glutamic endopeptidase [Gemmatimonadota bacterium]
MPNIPGLLTLAFFLVLVPFGSLKTRHSVGRLAALPREDLYRNIIGQQLLFASVALIAMFSERLDLGIGRVDPLAIGVAAVLVAVTVLLMRSRWKAAIARGEPRLAMISPRTARERGWWIAVSIVAGVSEELVWRGVVASLLWWVTGEWIIAAIVTSIAFGISHAIQGWKSATIIGVIALAVQAYVWWAGGLLLAMVMHAAYDVVAGLTYGKLADAAGLPVAAAPVPAQVPNG